MEKGGSGRDNIHCHVGEERYTYDDRTDAFWNIKGEKLPNKIRKNNYVEKMLKKAFKLYNKEW